MKHAVTLMALSTLAIPSWSAGQTDEPDQAPQAQPSSPAPPVPNVDRPVSWKLFLPNLASDQKRIWSFPARLVHGQHWIPTAAVLGTAAGLTALDPIEAGYFRQTSSFHGFNNVFTSNATTIGTIAVPASLYVIGRIRKDSKMEHTALFAGEALANAEILTTVLKGATKRVRPANVPIGGNFSDSWYDSGGSPFSGKASFPSGHTIAAFSVATVIARRYGNHRWVPYAAYGLAALVGGSRVSLSAHFLSDVFVGGALGYSISRFTVLRQ